MKKLIMCAIAAVTLAVPALSATPADARVFCYNLVTGQFSHWGYCRVLCTRTAYSGYSCRKIAK
jgi:hypothetical protein